MTERNDTHTPKLWGKDPWQAFGFVLGAGLLIYDVVFRIEARPLVVGAGLLLMGVPVIWNGLDLILRRNGNGKQ